MLYEKIIRPLIFLPDPETVHHFMIKSLGVISRIPPFASIGKKICAVNDPRLETKLGRLTLPNPIGLSAGFDKYIDAPLAYSMLGFGFAELGSITYSAQPGNPRPRLWRIPKDHGYIVYYGLSNNGAKQTAVALEKLPPHPIPYGISIAPTTGLSTETMADDYLNTLRALHQYADYITLNVSCPNVASQCVFTQISFITELVKKVMAEMREKNIRKDVFLKIGPDMMDADLDTIIDLCIAEGITGIIATNLVKKRESITPKSTATELNHPGGISGKLLQDKSDRVISHIYQRAKGKLQIIGVGGIFTAEDAYRKIKNGANAVQLITGFIYGGPMTMKNINQGLLRLLEKDGYKNISEAVGKLETTKI